jgi:hypothetical protein
MSFGRSLLTILAGGLAGLAGSALVHKSNASTPIAASSCDRPPREVVMASPALVSLTERVEQAPLPAQVPTITTEKPLPERVGQRPTASEQAAEDKRAFGQMLVAHEQEPRDRRWADFTEQTIQKSFELLGERTTSRLQKVDCRSESCVASLQWKDEAAARADIMTVVAYSGDGTQCSRSMVLGGDGQDPSVGKLFFDCSSRFETEGIQK